MDEHPQGGQVDDAAERYKHLPEPIRLSQVSTAHAAVPGSAVIFFGAPMPFGDGANHGDGD